MHHNLNIGHSFILLLSHSWSIAILATEPFIAVVMEIGMCTMLLYDMETWLPSAMWSFWVFSVLFVVRILCYSMFLFSWSFFEQEELNLFVSILVRPFTCTRSLPALTVRVGWCSLFRISSGIIYDFFIVRTIVQNEGKFLVLLAALNLVLLQLIFF